MPSHTNEQVGELAEVTEAERSVLAEEHRDPPDRSTVVPEGIAFPNTCSHTSESRGRVPETVRGCGNASMAKPSTIDRQFGQAMVEAAHTLAIAPGAEVRERTLEAAVLVSLSNHLAGTPIPRRGPYRIPGWKPQLGAVDVRIENGAGETIVVAELKVEKTDESLWDIFKMLAAARLPQTLGAYVVVAASGTTWAGGRECADLFPPPGRPPLEIRSARLFDRYWRSWTHLLLEGSAKPTRVPDVFEATPVAAAPIGAAPGWELRAISVRPSGHRALPFKNGWPIGMQPGP